MPNVDGEWISGRRRTVLYIEDDLSNLALVERVLARRPAITLLVAMEGTIGIDLAHQHRPDLVLLDMNLPDLSGDVVLARLAEDPRTQGVPVVMVSGDTSAMQMERLKAAGAVDYVTKPFDVSQFLAVVDHWLDRGPEATPADHPTAAAADEPLTLDLDAARQLRSLDDRPGGRMCQVVELFLTRAEANIRDLGAAVIDRDVADVHQITHDLKGGAANFGARRLPVLCERLDAHATDGEWLDADGLTSEIDGEFARFRAALRDVFGLESPTAPSSTTS